MQWIYGPSPFGESRVVAKRLAEITKPDDYVYVLGTEQQILYYAKRLNSSRFITDAPLTLYSPMQQRYNNENKVELQDHPPQAIVLEMKETYLWQEQNNPNSVMPSVLNMIKANYQLVGGFVWDNSSGYWQEPMTQQSQINNSSFLLYKKK